VTLYSTLGFDKTFSGLLWQKATKKQGIRRHQTLPWYRNAAPRIAIRPIHGQTWRHP